MKIARNRPYCITSGVTRPMWALAFLLALVPSLSHSLGLGKGAEHRKGYSDRRAFIFAAFYNAAPSGKSSARARSRPRAQSRLVYRPAKLPGNQDARAHCSGHLVVQLTTLSLSPSLTRTLVRTRNIGYSIARENESTQHT